MVVTNSGACKELTGRIKKKRRIEILGSGIRVVRPGIGSGRRI